MRARRHYEPATASSPEFSPALRSSHEGSSLGAVSPVSPATPRSTEGHIPTLNTRVKRMDGPGHVAYVSEHPDYRAPGYHLDYHRRTTTLSTGPDRRVSASRAPESDDGEGEPMSMKRPLRPW